MMKKTNYILVVIGFYMLGIAASVAQSIDYRIQIQHKEKNKEIIEYHSAKDAMKATSHNSIVTLISGKEQIAESMILKTPLIIESKGGALLLGGVFEDLESNVQNKEVIPLLDINNYPNPFKKETVFRYELPFDTKVMIKVYDIRGREMITLVDKEEKAGVKTLTWNGNGSAGKKLNPGIYISIISFDQHKETRRIVIE